MAKMKSTSTGVQYFIFASGTPHQLVEHFQVLLKDSNTDKFVSLLSTATIVLDGTPNPAANLDSSDAWRKWLTTLSPAGNFSLTVDNGFIQSFEFKLMDPWNLTFSSSEAALDCSFDAASKRIPHPGISLDGHTLYCGLDTSQNKIFQSTVDKAFGYAGLANLVPSLPTSLQNMPITLHLSNATKKCNALWFKPSFGPQVQQVTVQLYFSLDKAQELQKVLAVALPGLEFQTADVVCKKVLEGETEPVDVHQGKITFTVDCTVTPNETPAVKMIAGIEFQKSNITVTLKLDTRDQTSLTAIFEWLSRFADLHLVENVLRKAKNDNALKEFYIRRMTFNLDKAVDAEKPTLSNFLIDIEIPVTFGMGTGTQPATFLLTYKWPEQASESIFTCQFWNHFDLSGDQKLTSSYEPWADLQPITKPTPTTSADLLSIIPGQIIEYIPDTIPAEIKGQDTLFLTISEDKFALSGTIRASKSTDTIPRLDLGDVQLDASYTWGMSSAFKIGFGVSAALDTITTENVAVLKGRLDYNSSVMTWKLIATLTARPGGTDLHASALYKFFDESSAKHVMPLVQSIAIGNIDVNYIYPRKDKTGEHFTLIGPLLVATLKLTLTLEYNGNADDWTLMAALDPHGAQASVGDIISSILGDDQLGLPDFLANMQFDGGEGTHDNLSIDVAKGSTLGSFHFIAEVTITREGMTFVLTFIQYHSGDWSESVHPKIIAKIAVTKLGNVEVPLVGNLTQPFDEMYYMWIQDATGQNKKERPGLTRKEVKELNDNEKLSDKLVCKDGFKGPDDSLVVIGAGSHFAVVIKDLSGKRTCILDYEFMKPEDTPTVHRRLLGEDSDESESRITTVGVTEAEAGDDSGSSAHAPFKKKVGPLSISSIGLKYSAKTLHIMFDATFELGPIELSLVGFSINVRIARLDEPPSLNKPIASLEGLSIAFAKPPLTISGIIRHGKTGTLDYYSGGLVVGYDPYQLQAAGFYGKATASGRQFTSVFIFAKLDGPLVTLEFAEISGVTGGFGYKSDVRIPSIDQVVDFPFIATHTLENSTGTALAALEKLTSPEAGGWFMPLDNTYWAAAGLKVEAFKMLMLDAVVVVQFEESIKLGIFAVAHADIPTEELKYAHVELGIAMEVDCDYGVLKAEAQLSPNSYILDPSCHLTGGSSLYYWFDAPHADQSKVGNFVFTLGGYHRAFAIPDGYPNPPRLAISWSLGRHLSIKGEAYFAITPKACMGGGRLIAALKNGPIQAWFDAFADFLINYKPFHFTAQSGVSVGVRYDMKKLFIHIHISVEIGAQLYLWGPPFAGRVHVDFWIMSFDIPFGGDLPDDPKVITLKEFYKLVVQATADGTDTPNEGHVFLVQSGLMNNSEVPQKAPWIVRGGTFSFVVSCKMAIDTAIRGDKDKIQYGEVHAKPMKSTNKLSSTLTVEITQDGVQQDQTEWGMKKIIKSLPSGLWAKWEPDKDPSDPSSLGNLVPELLNSQPGGIPLMMGVLLTAPPPKMAPDKLPKFNIEDAYKVELTEKPFPPPNSSHIEWEPEEPQAGAAQWKAVHDNWKDPAWGLAGQAGFVKEWSKASGWDEDLSSWAAMPKRLEKKFGELYVASPLTTK